MSNALRHLTRLQFAALDRLRDGPVSLTDHRAWQTYESLVRRGLAERAIEYQPTPHGTRRPIEVYRLVPDAPKPKPTAAPPARRGPSRPAKPLAPKKRKPGWFRLDGLVDARYIATDEAARARGCRFVHRCEFRTYRGFGSVGEDGGMAIRMCTDEEVPENLRIRATDSAKRADIEGGPRAAQSQTA